METSSKPVSKLDQLADTSAAALTSNISSEAQNFIESKGGESVVNGEPAPSAVSAIDETNNRLKTAAAASAVNNNNNNTVSDTNNNNNNNSNSNSNGGSGNGSSEQVSSSSTGSPALSASANDGKQAASLVPMLGELCVEAIIRNFKGIHYYYQY